MWIIVRVEFCKRVHLKHEFCLHVERQIGDARSHDNSTAQKSCMKARLSSFLIAQTEKSLPKGSSSTPAAASAIQSGCASVHVGVRSDGGERRRLAQPSRRQFDWDQLSGLGGMNGVKKK
jgi:hypothetical protein